MASLLQAHALIMFDIYRSPNHYAHQRTMVVMETVRAATLATARRLERLASEAEKQKQQQQQLSSTPGAAAAKHSQ